MLPTIFWHHCSTFKVELNARSLAIIYIQIIVVINVRIIKLFAPGFLLLESGLAVKIDCFLLTIASCLDLQTCNPLLLTVCITG